MKALILDHHFRQDIESLLAANGADHVVRTVSPDYFASRATEFFPPAVFGPDFSEYHRPDLGEARAAYRHVARRLLGDLYKVFPFELFISPSDTFFYIRDVIDACGELGIPFVVVQKELGVSTKALEQHAQVLRQWFPFKGDWMTTCSEKSRDFWVASGARPEQVSVVGQPRFDLYGQPERWLPLSQLALQVPAGRSVLLFLSYDLDAYDEERALGRSHRPWEQLHCETEAVLKAMAESEAWTVLLKPHPQQDATTLAAIEQRLGHTPNLQILCGGLDTRQLIVGSDAVVGFQTTALAEAMAVGKKVIYTFWTEPVLRAQRALLPFHELDDCIYVARSPQELQQAIQAEPLSDNRVLEKRRRFFESYLGPVDGQASQRVWAVLEQLVAHWPVPTPAARSLRSELRVNLAAYCTAETARARRRLGLRRTLSALTGASRVTSGSRIHQLLELICQQEADRIDECRQAALNTYTPVGRLAGRSDENLFLRGVRYARRRWLGGVPSVR